MARVHTQAQTRLPDQSSHYFCFLSLRAQLCNSAGVLPYHDLHRGIITLSKESEVCHSAVSAEVNFRLLQKWDFLRVLSHFDQHQVS